MGRTIAVTGVSGYLGRALLGRLEARPDVERVIGLDTREVPIRTPKLEFHTFDVLDPGLDKMIAGADTLVHLAFCVDPMRDATLMREVNVGGFRCVLDALEAAGTARFVYPSSGAAYGAHPDNAVPLSEDAPLRPNLGFPYAEHKAETEAILETWAAAHPDISVVALRPAIVLGAHVDNFMSRALESPRLVTVAGYAPPLQFLHEEDFAEALVHFTLGDHVGVFNVCADGALDLEDVVRIVGRRKVTLREDFVFPLADLAWKAGIAELPPGELNFLLYPCVLSNERARATGWAPTHGNAQIVAATAESHRDHVTVGTVRMSRAGYERAVRTAAVAGAAAGLLGLLVMRRLLRA